MLAVSFAAGYHHSLMVFFSLSAVSYSFMDRVGLGDVCEMMHIMMDVESFDFTVGILTGVYLSNGVYFFMWYE